MLFPRTFPKFYYLPAFYQSLEMILFQINWCDSPQWSLARFALIKCQSVDFLFLLFTINVPICISHFKHVNGHIRNVIIFRTHRKTKTQFPEKLFPTFFSLNQSIYLQSNTHTIYENTFRKPIQLHNLFSIRSPFYHFSQKIVLLATIPMAIVSYIHRLTVAVLSLLNELYKLYGHPKILPKERLY